MSLTEIARFEIKPLGRHHDRAAFSCEEASLEEFLKNKLSQDIRNGYCAAFIMQEIEQPSKIVGYYTLSNHSIKLSDIPISLSKKLPRYPDIPTTLLGRMARDTSYKGQMVGEILLLDALKKSLYASKDTSGSYAVTVDPINEKSDAFYRKYGFLPLEGQKRLYLPLATVERMGL